jgi:hypothetical protein
MPERRLLYLSPYRLTAFRWEAGVLLGEGLFEASAEGHRLFAAYLAQHAASLFSLLCNAAEEGFQIESLPFLRGAYRRAILQRKLGQLFFNAPLTASLSLGHEKSRRKNERVLLAALSGQDFLPPWLAALNQAQAVLSGIYSLPFLGGTLLEKLNITDRCCLLLTVQDQSLRQSYFEQGKLYFSRLTPLQNSSAAHIAQTFSDEAHKLQQYLSSQRIIADQEPLTVHLLAHADIRQAIAAACRDTSTLHFNLLTLEDCAKKLGMRNSPIDNHSEALFLYLLGRRAPRPQFANDEQRHPYHLWWLRRALYGAGALTLVGCLLLAGQQALGSFGVDQENQQRAIEAHHARQHYAEIVQTFPPLPASHETLHRVIDRYSALENDSPTPEALYFALGRALNTPSASPVRIDEIDWMLVVPPVAEANALPPGKLDDVQQIATLRGSVQLTANASPRQVLAAFKLFLDALKNDSQLQILVLQPPVDLESSKSSKPVPRLNDGLEASSDEEKMHRFTLQMGRKRGS